MGGSSKTIVSRRYIAATAEFELLTLLTQLVAARSAAGEFVDPSPSGGDVEWAAVTDQHLRRAALVDEIDHQPEIALGVVAEVVLVREARSDRATCEPSPDKVADDEDVGSDDHRRSGSVPPDHPVFALDAELVEVDPVVDVDARGEGREVGIDESLDEPSTRAGRDQLGIVAVFGDRPVGSSEHHRNP